MKDTSIKWTNHTFNPWWGCSVGCEYCYAKAYAKMRGHRETFEGGPYRQLSDEYWELPLKWNEEAKENKNV